MRLRCAQDPRPGATPGPLSAPSARRRRAATGAKAPLLRALALALALAPTGAAAAGLLQACAADFRSLCDGTALGGGWALDCLAAQADALSPACRAALGPAQPPPAASPAAASGCPGLALPEGPDSGADGPYPMTRRSLPDPAGGRDPVQIFAPEGAPGPRPVIFFAHGYGPNHWQGYEPLLRHLVSRGAFVVFAPFAMFGQTNDQRYDSLWQGFRAAAQAEPRMDLSRVAFLGHSFGGGAAPWLAYQGLVKQGWGKNGALLMLLAPWYAHRVTDAELAALPANLVIAAEVYDDDRVNDHRIAIELYRHLPAGAGKYFFLAHSGRSPGCRLDADHATPGRNPSLPLKRLVLFRPLDALLALAFDGSAAARADLARMGSLRLAAYTPLTLEATPTPQAPQSQFRYRWNSPKNPRRAEASW